MSLSIFATPKTGILQVLEGMPDAGFREAEPLIRSDQISAIVQG